MKKIILILLIMLSSCTNDKDCSEERTNIYNKYQDLINKATNNKDEQDRLRDERDYKLASLKC